MSGIMHIIYQGEQIRVRSFKVDSSDVIVTFGPWRQSNSLESKGVWSSFGVSAVSKLGVTHISVETNRNNWYQTEEIKFAIKAIIKHLDSGSVVYTYGSSMGGYAAVNFSHLLGAKKFLAISPQYSSNYKLFPSDEKRWITDLERVSNHYDYISNDMVADTSGFILYDPEHIDSWHANKIHEKIDCKIIDLPGSGHPSGTMINKFYGLKRLVSEVLSDDFCATKMRNEYEGAYKQSVYGQLRSETFQGKADLLMMLSKSNLSQDFLVYILDWLYDKRGEFQFVDIARYCYWGADISQRGDIVTRKFIKLLLLYNQVEEAKYICRFLGLLDKHTIERFKKHGVSEESILR